MMSDAVSDGVDVSSARRVYLSRGTHVMHALCHNNSSTTLPALHFQTRERHFLSFFFINNTNICMLALALQPFLLTGPAGFGLRLSTTVAV